MPSSPELERAAGGRAWLAVAVTGGAGYVGGAVTHALVRAGARVTVIDSLVHSRRPQHSLPFLQLDIRDTARLEQALAGHHAVCHLAALANIPESFARPHEFHDVNVGGTQSVIAAMGSAGLRHLVFASTCAIYAPTPDGAAFCEGDREAPESPYAETKRAAELAIEEAVARREGDLRATCLRFFNAAGADVAARVGEDHEPETHAIPRLLRWARGTGDFAIFGRDYPTPDGTCIRDYVHVADLADAHVHALRATLGGRSLPSILNLGTGVGTSVHELTELACQLAGVPPDRRPPVIARRPGDAPVLVARPQRAREILGWEARRGIDEILRDALWWELQRTP